MKNGRILGGTLHDESVNFTFQVWSSRELTKKELWADHRVWARGRDRRKTVKNKIVDFALP
jgi:hypothetical protein